MKFIVGIFLIIFITSCSSTNSIPENKEEKELSSFSINNSWKLETINQLKIDKIINGNKVPELTFDENIKQVIGNDGCNQIRASLKQKDEKNIIFAMIGGTKMLCPNMKNTDRFIKALNFTRTYKVKDHYLYFYDIDGNEVLQFVKTIKTNNK
jgi:heat shock protein HslJ